MRKPILVAALLPSVLLAACAVGPNYRRPYTPVTETYSHSGKVQTLILR